MNVTDMSNVTVDGTETVFATVTDDAKGFKTRIFIKKNGTQYQIGCTSLAAATPAIYDATLYNVGSTVLVITGYDFSTNELKMWVNPTVAGFTAATPATITETPVAAFANLGGFLLRQDAATNTPTITIDELKAGVTPAQVLAVNKIDNIAGLKVYPNPVTNGKLFISSDNGETKTAEIYNVLGKTVLSTTVTTESINVSSLSKGVYILKVTENEKTATRKLIIE